MQFKNISIGKTAKMNDEVECTVEHEGRSIRLKCTRSTKGWNVYFYATNEVWRPKKGKLQDIFIREIGMNFIGTREEFIESAWQMGRKKSG